ncbi:MAG TPA: DUF6152 family protein [Bryobacteraceae bacterium]|jgi:hypothetical protein
MTRTLPAYFALATLLVLTFSTTAPAHHNMSANFDFNDRVTVSGTLSKIDWRNPHIEFMVDTKSASGDAETWKYEGPAPSFFRERNVGKADFEGALGKQVTVEASRARDGSRWGLLRQITLPGDKLVSACPQNC